MGSADDRPRHVSFRAIRRGRPAHRISSSGRHRRLHCAAKDYESTDWPQILSLYDRLIEFDDSPVVALNRAIVVANIHGPQAGLDAVAAIQRRDKLKSYYLLYAVLGEFEARLNNSRKRRPATFANPFVW